MESQPHIFGVFILFPCFSLMAKAQFKISIGKYCNKQTSQHVISANKIKTLPAAALKF